MLNFVYMNLEIFKRNIKLQELGIDKLSCKEQEVLDFLNEHLTNLNKYTNKQFPHYLSIGKDIDSIILEYNEIDKYLYVDYDKIWSLLQSTFNMEYGEIKELIQWWIVKSTHLDINDAFIE